MPIGETTEEHKKWQQEEAQLVAEDRSSNQGLFRGCFRLTGRRILPLIRDHEDGVDRCPRCTWELEDGLCNSCGYPSGEDSDNSSELESEAYPYDDEIAEFPPDGFVMDLDFMRVEHERAIERRRGRADGFRGTPASDVATPYDSFLDETDSEDDEFGSLDGFVVNDMEDRPAGPSELSSVSWSSNEEAEMEGTQAHLSDEDRGSQEESVSASGDSIFGGMHDHDTNEDSDEEPVRSIRPSRSRRPAVSLTSDQSGSSGFSRAMDEIRSRRQNTEDELPQHALGRPNLHNVRHHARNSTTLAPGSRNTASYVFEVPSDSDDTVPVDRPRRRRPVQNILSSDEESVNGSSGTATVGSHTSVAIPQRSRSENERPNTQTSNASSPILIGSSPVRSAVIDPVVPGAFPPSFSHSERSQSVLPLTAPPSPPAALAIGSELTPPVNHGAHSSPRNTTFSGSRMDLSPSHAHLPEYRSSVSHTTRLHPPLHSPAPRSPRSPEGVSRPTQQERFEQGVRNRAEQKAARKAERRRMKAEHDQRRRDQAGPSESPDAAQRVVMPAQSAPVNNYSGIRF